jgi:hypothetical protein
MGPPALSEGGHTRVSTPDARAWLSVTAGEQNSLEAGALNFACEGGPPLTTSPERGMRGPSAGDDRWNRIVHEAQGRVQP